MAEGANIGLLMLRALHYSNEVVLLPSDRIQNVILPNGYDIRFSAVDKRKFTPPNVRMSEPIIVKRSKLTMSLMRQWSKADGRINLGTVMRENPYTTLALRVYVDSV